MTAPEDTLRCGRDVDDILNQVADGLAGRWDEHQRRCPHCQAALAEYDRLWAPFRELAAERVSAPDSVVDSALARIRGAVEHADYGVLTSPDGVTRVSARVVVVAARHTAQQVPGVRVALSKHLTGTPVHLPGVGSHDTDVTAGVAGRSTAIEITLAADYGQDLIALGEQVRRRVADQVRIMTDLEPVQVTVLIDDVFD